MQLKIKFTYFAMKIASAEIKSYFTETREKEIGACFYGLFYLIYLQAC